MKRLYLMRHAKSSWKQPELDDHQRPLNKRGKKAAPEMGRRLNRRGIRLDAIVSSDARRAVDTAAAVAETVGVTAKNIHLDADLYHASPDRILKAIGRFDDPWTQVMLVGHNPGFTALANRFYPHTIANVPTAGIVALTFETASWKHINRNNLTFSDFDYPKNKG
jgi:phosphohistidine phosphatase